MDFEIVWTEEAKQMLMKIFDGLMTDDPAMAAGVVRSIYRKVQILQEYPQIGWFYSHTSRREVYILLFGHYRIAYEVHGSGYIVILGTFIDPCSTGMAFCDTFLQQYTTS